MKKVAVICNYILRPDRIGGMDRFFCLFDKQLKEKKYSVDWFFTDYISFDFYKDLNTHSAGDLSVENNFLEISKKNNYDIIITHFTELCTKFYKDLKIDNPNSYIIAVDHNPRPLEGFPLRKRVIKRVKSTLYANYIDQFIAVSDYSKEHLINDFGNRIRKKIRIVYNGILSNNYIQKTSYNYQGRFIVACHLRKEKGIQYLINSVHKLKKSEQEKITVDIYGEGPYLNELEGLVDEYKLENIFCFKKSVSNLYEIYYKYDYLIHPSLGETFCYTVVESLLCKLPVITTKNAGNVLSLVKNNLNGFLVKERDEEELLIILRNIINNKKSINKLNIESVILPDLSLSKMVKEHLKIINI